MTTEQIIYKSNSPNLTRGVLLFMLLLFIFLLFFFYPIYPHFYFLHLWLFLGILLSFIAQFLIGPIIIYSDGIVPSYKPFIVLLRNRTYFIPFNKIRKIGLFHNPGMTPYYYFYMNDKSIAFCEIGLIEWADAQKKLEKELLLNCKEISRFNITSKTSFGRRKEIKQMIDSERWQNVKIRTYIPK